MSVPPTEPARPADVQARFCATLVDEWVQLGVRHALVAPGSRSTPLALALVARPELRTEVFLDERSAAFAALGVGMASGAPAVVVCTSGTAATHFHAAVVEAALSGVPLLVVTADRPPELRDVGAAQAIDQTKLFGASPRWFHDPGVPDSVGVHGWRSLAARAWAAAGGAQPGPVHLNLPFREPLLGVAGVLPSGRGAVVARPTASLDDADLTRVAELLERQRGLIIAGGGIEDAETVAQFAESVGWPLLADPRSGCRGRPASVAAFDSLLRHREFADAHAPEVVLWLGERPASKVLAQWVVSTGAMQVHVDGRGRVIDPDHRVAWRLAVEPSAVCATLGGTLKGATGTPWLARWRHAEERAQGALSAAIGAQSSLSEPAVARAVTGVGASLVVASSMPVRDVEWFGDPTSTAAVLANRGANGIDGVVATAIGVALATGGPTVALLGDVAFVHDSSSLAGLGRRGVDLRIVVIDNDGGGIFSFLPQATNIAGPDFERLFGTPHGTDVLGLGRAHGVPGVDVTTREELEDALQRSGPVIVRVRTDRAENVAIHASLNAAVVRALS